MTGFVSNSKDTLEGGARTPIIRAVLIGLTLFTGEPGRRMVFDGWQQVSPRTITADNIAVIEIDDVAVSRVSEWPWPRYQMSQLIRLIGNAQPRAIGIDIYFTERDRLSPEAFAERYLPEEMDEDTRRKITALPDMDYVFGTVIGDTPSVMARVGVDEGGADPGEYFFDPEVAGEAPPNLQSYDRVLASLFNLDGAAMGHGMVNGAPDSDGVVRRIPLAVTVGEAQSAGFAAELARVASGTEQLQWQDGELAMGDSLLPADFNGNFRFRMGNIPQAAKFSALEVMNNEVPAQALAGKIVLVGVTAQGTYDIVATPIGSETYGVFVQAMAVDAMLEGAWLSRPTSMVVAEIAAGLLLLLLIVIAAVTTRSWPLKLALGFALALPLISWLAYTQVGLLFDPVRPLLVGICAAIALTVTRYAIARKERARLAAELVEERVAASEQKGELEAARRIQMSMVPGEKTLAKLDPRAEIGRVLRPAKSVGGDFFDAVKINENLLLFLVADVTGKGVPAALFMALSKTLSKSNLARAGDGLDKALAALNVDLMDEADDEMGLTMLVGTLDCATGALQMINAGHENPMVVRSDGTVETFAMKGGPPLCVIDFPYSTEPLKLKADETLVVISDGATEAANKEDDLFGMTGVIDALEAAGNTSAQDRATQLAEKIETFEGANDPTDDLTIFALRYRGAEA